MTNGRLALAAAALIAMAAPAAAGEAQERIFRVGLLEGVETGQSLIFGHERGGSLAVGNLAAIEGGAVELAVVAGEEGRAARIELRAGGAPTGRLALPADGGHPMLLVFLETSARAMAELTGGSPFYIRNRMREALAEDVALEPVEVTVGGEPVSAEAATFRPFDDDPNRAEMGPFAELALTMVLSDAVPGGFARFEAMTGPGANGAPAFSQTIVFERQEES